MVLSQTRKERAISPSIDLLSEWKAMLQLRHNGVARLWHYTVSHAMLLIRIETASLPTLIVELQGCSRIESSSIWVVDTIDIEEKSLDQYRFSVSDRAANFAVLCDWIVIREEPNS
jgi:hypothetical protein